MSENINKPITLVREDFQIGLAELCNNSGLPFFIIESILKDFIQEVHVASQKQFELEKAKYNEELEKIKNKK